ncbi:MAG: carbohydrate-binding protein [Bacteroidota bacterium]
MYRYYFLLISLLIGTGLDLSAQSFLRTDGQHIINEEGEAVLLKGMGLGGWMLQEGYMMKTAGFANAQFQIKEKITEVAGAQAMEEFYEAWLANHVRKVDIDSLKAWGFNSVRLPMHYNLFTLPIEKEPVPGEHTWLSKGFELTDSLLSWCRDNQMYVILDLHAAPGGQGQDQGISDYDTTKPSLWESKANRDKTVALWMKLAERYKDDPLIAGYDLINEPNWPLDENILLRELYGEITDSIRSIDAQHIIFIEGNWFANDFTGLTPPWDGNMVYSPHKYWSINDQASIQWVLDIRDTYDIPLYFGETGENSNVWFRDAIQLFAEHEIGWAWWPMKKIDDIAGPLSVSRSSGYQSLLEYWEGNGPSPGAQAAKNILMELTEDIRLENCKYQKDVVDAIFRQLEEDTAIPFAENAIPGVVFATDYDMGGPGIAYEDNALATYHVSTGNYTAWNNGWAYRNDGVDIEISEETVNSNGFNVGWLDQGEWMQYHIAVSQPALYDINLRVAADGGDGRFHLGTDGADITATTIVPNTGGWQNWQTVTLRDVFLTPDDQTLTFHVDAAGFNLSSLQFSPSGNSSELSPYFVSAYTSTENAIQLNINKPLQESLPSLPAGFSVYVDGTIIPITTVKVNPENPRIIGFTLDHEFKSRESVQISYSGSQVLDIDKMPLGVFTRRVVQNNLPTVHEIPDRVQAEDYFFQQGIQLENTTDTGGGQNIGFLDPGDYLDYYLNVDAAGVYEVAFRTAALSETGAIALQLVDESGNTSILGEISFPPTGGWQSWTTTSTEVELPSGLLQIRILITQPLFNINWFEFSLLRTTAVSTPGLLSNFIIYPNPSMGTFILAGSTQEVQRLTVKVANSLGQVFSTYELPTATQFKQRISLQDQPNGWYFVIVANEKGEQQIHRILKVSQ